MGTPMDLAPKVETSSPPHLQSNDVELVTCAEDGEIAGKCIMLGDATMVQTSVRPQEWFAWNFPLQQHYVPSIQVGMSCMMINVHRSEL